MNCTRTNEVIAALRGMFGPHAMGFGAALITQDATGLLPGESAGGPRVVDARLCEFAAGRRAARAAMADLGLPPAALPRGADRAPVWPNGLRGAITHAGGIALCVIAKGQTAPGLDVEPNEDLPEELLPVLLRPEEQAWCAQQPNPLRMARLLFVIKEAGYKAQYQHSHAFIGFQHARVEVQSEGRFMITLLERAGCFRPGTTLEGRFAQASGLILAGTVVPAPVRREMQACSDA